MVKRYVVELNAAEHQELEGLLRKGKLSVRKVKRAQILLAAAKGRIDEHIAATVGVHVHTVERTRKQFMQGGLEQALNDDPYSDNQNCN